MFRRIALAVAVLAVMAAMIGASPAGSAEPQKKINILLVTGGHDYDIKGFDAMWERIQKNVPITIRRVHQKTSSEALTEENLKDIDVIVTYDMIGKTTEAERAALESFLQRGGDLVVTHHSIAAHPDWPRWSKLIGAKYFLKPNEEWEGKKYPQSGYQHDVDMDIKVADPNHPITKGISDFKIHDESYNKYVVAPDVHVLLTTDHPTADKNVAWVREEGKSRIAFIQLGHDNQAYTNPNFQKFLENAIVWANGQ